MGLYIEKSWKVEKLFSVLTLQYLGIQMLNWTVDNGIKPSVWDGKA